MPRIRTIKPQFFLNEELSELPAMTRLLFIGLWLHADREGRMIDRPKRLKAEIFPYENYDMEKGLKQLSDAGFILRYKVVDENQPEVEQSLIQVLNFSKHQKIDKLNEKESELPEPQYQDYYKTITRLPIAGEGKGKEGNKEGKEGAEAPRPRFVKPDPCEVINYFCELNLDDFSAQAEAQKFMNYYDSNGWKVGKSKMKDWKAAARNWKDRINNFKNEGTKGIVASINAKPGTSAARIEALKNW